MIDLDKAISFLENSFLAPLLKKKSITDISYNGEDIFYLDTEVGRKISNIKVNEIEVKDFIRHLSNIAEKQFSYSEPILEISIGKYRITALHHSLVRKKGLDAQSFSIRIASDTIKINDDDNFMPKEVKELFKYLIDTKTSIIIAGLTGSGKTELQKYLISLMDDNVRVIIIDNLLELDYVSYKDSLDINVWQSNEKKESSSLQNLIKVALRNNPDWLIVAESRGKEANDMLTSLLTGHPIITTIHAFDAESIPNRFARLVMSDDKRSDYDSLLEDIFYHLHFYVYVEKSSGQDGRISRYIKEIIYFDEKGEKTKIFEKTDKGYRYQKINLILAKEKKKYPLVGKYFFMD